MAFHNCQACSGSKNEVWIVFARVSVSRGLSRAVSEMMDCIFTLLDFWIDRYLSGSEHWILCFKNPRTWDWGSFTSFDTYSVSFV